MLTPARFLNTKIRKLTFSRDVTHNRIRAQPPRIIISRNYAKKRGALSGIKVLGLPPGVSKKMLEQEFERFRELEAQKQANPKNTKVQVEAPPQLESLAETQTPKEKKVKKKSTSKKAKRKTKASSKETTEQAESQPQVVSYHDKAMEAANEGKYDEALDLFRMALKEEPYNPLVHYNLGVVAEAAKHNELALEAYASARKMLPDDPDIPCSMARVHASMVKDSSSQEAELHRQKAKEYLEEALKLKPGDTEITINYCHILNELQMFKEAQKILKKTLLTLAQGEQGEEEAFQMAIANRLMGDANAGLQLYDKALRHYKMSLMINRGDAETMLKVGELYQSVFERPEKALIYYKASLKLDPEAPNANILLGSLYMQPGWPGYDLDKAREHVETELLLHPTPEALFQVGYVNLQLGNIERAVECLEKTRRYKLSDPHSYMQATVLLADVYSNADDQEALTKALALYKEAMSLDAQRIHTDLKTKYAALLRRLGRLDEALGMLYQARQEDPTAVENYTNLAEIFFERNLYDDALKAVNQGYKVAPEDSKLNFWLGRHHFHANDLVLATQHLEVSVKSLPPPIPPNVSPEHIKDIEGPPEYAGQAHYLLAKSYEQLGQRDNVIYHLELAAEYMPNDHSLQLALSKQYLLRNERKKSQQALRKAAVLSPFSITPNLLLADSLVEDERFEQAIAYYEKILEIIKARVFNPSEDTVTPELVRSVYIKLADNYNKLAILENNAEKALLAQEYMRLADDLPLSNPHDE